DEDAEVLVVAERVVFDRGRGGVGGEAEDAHALDAVLDDRVLDRRRRPGRHGEDVQAALGAGAEARAEPVLRRHEDRRFTRAERGGDDDDVGGVRHARRVAQAQGLTHVSTLTFCAFAALAVSHAEPNRSMVCGPVTSQPLWRSGSRLSVVPVAVGPTVTWME